MFFMLGLISAHMRLARGNGLDSGDLTKALFMRGWQSTRTDNACTDEKRHHGQQNHDSDTA